MFVRVMIATGYKQPCGRSQQLASSILIAEVVELADTPS